MAANKIYTVVKDGEELDKVKTLAAAKKLADAEGAEVYSDGRCVYQASVEVSEGTETGALKDSVSVGGAEDPLEKEDKTNPTPAAEDKKAASVKYRLKALMNVREKPNGRIKDTLPEGTVVEVLLIENDWLHLVDGSFILYGRGEWAEKIG